MRLEAPNAEGDSHIAIARRDKIIKRLDLCNVVLRRGRQLFRLLANRLIRLYPVTFQAGIPAANLIPALEGAELDVGNIVFIVVRLLLLFLFVELVVVLDFQDRVLPQIRGAAVGSPNLRLHRLAAHLQLAAGRDIDQQPLIQDNRLLNELLLPPELSRSKGLEGVEADVIFKHVTSGETGHDHILLMKVAVHRGFACNRRSQVLYRIGTGGCNRAVWLRNLHRHNVNLLIGGVIRKMQYAEGLHPGLCLNANARDLLPLRGAVILKANRGQVFVHDKRLLRVVGGLLRCGRWSEGCFGFFALWSRQRLGWLDFRRFGSVLQAERRYGKEKQEDGNSATHTALFLL